MNFRQLLSEFPLVAILRGLAPESAAAIGAALVDAGFRMVEVPLNSPQPFVSIERLARAFPDTMIGAGTVLDPQDVDRVRDAGGRLIVMPHSDPAVIARARELRLACTPGVATPSEGFAALKGGADAIKLFPADAMPPAVVRAWRAVFPKDALFLPVGGIKPDTMQAFVEGGADGFGLGSALFTPSLSAAEVAQNARRFAEAWRNLAADRSRAGRP